MYQTKQHILEYFESVNKLAAFRLSVYVKCKYNNHFHRSDIKQASSDLKLSRASIYKSLAQLIECGACVKVSDTYYSFVSWRKWLPKQKTRNIDFSISELRDIKKIKTQYYFLKVKTAIRYAKKNNSNLDNVAKARSGYYSCSASFTKSCNILKKHTSTISRQIRRCSNDGLIKIKSDYRQIFKGSKNNCIFFLNQYINIYNKYGYIKYNKELGLYEVLNVYSNKLKVVV